MNLAELAEAFAHLAPAEQQLALHLLPWAQRTHPEKYESILRVAVTRRGLLARVLHRLFEVAWETDKTFCRTLPLSLFEHSRIIGRFRHKTSGKVFEVRGALCDGARCWGWAQLAVDEATFQSMMTVQESELGPLDFVAGHHKLTVLALDRHD